jgi:hypothetical protein
MFRIVNKIFSAIAHFFSLMYVRYRYSFSVVLFEVVVNYLMTIDDIFTVFQQKIRCIDPSITSENFPIIPTCYGRRIKGKIIRMGQLAQSDDVCEIFRANLMRPIELHEILFLAYSCSKLLRGGKLVALGSAHKDPQYGELVPVVYRQGRGMLVRLEPRVKKWSQDTQFPGVFVDNEQ